MIELGENDWHGPEALRGWRITEDWFTIEVSESKTIEVARNLLELSKILVGRKIHALVLCRRDTLSKHENLSKLYPKSSAITATSRIYNIPILALVEV